MPYLTCPECHISVFRAPLDLRPAQCPRCGVATASAPRYGGRDSPARFAAGRPAALLEREPAPSRSRPSRFA